MNIFIYLTDLFPVMENDSLLLKLTGDMPLFRILDFLIENKGMDFSKQDIAQGAEISKASLFNYWPTLIDNKIIRATRRFGKTTLFTLDAQSPIVQKLLELEMVLINQSLSSKAKIEKDILTIQT